MRGRPGVVLLLVCVATGCAAHRSTSAADPFVGGAAGQPGERSDAGSVLDQSETGSTPRAAAVRPDSAPVARRSDLPTIETRDPALANALATLAASPGAGTHRRVAAEYFRLQIYDMAHRHFTRAIELDPTDGPAFDGLARTWRDWGLPRQGLSHAYMAVYLSPDSAAAQNTLGTLLYALGNTRDARKRFEMAASLDPSAAYALNNLCYVSFLAGDQSRAADECVAALTRAPALRTARNNLALVHAAAGRLDLTERELLAGGDKSEGYYNLGIVHMARRDYALAAEAFETAFREAPSMAEAQSRARQARRLLADQGLR